MRGRKVNRPNDFEEIVQAWDKGDIKSKEAIELLGVSPATFYRWVNDWREEEGGTGEIKEFHVYPVKRDLDTFYFRVIRDRQQTTLCFTDLTEKEQRQALVSFDAQTLRKMVVTIAQNYRETADKLNLKG